MSRGEWRIDALAAETGVPSRTIREYQTLGLLDPPERVGRVGVYRESHQRRLALIVRLQARGYSLAGIKDLLESLSAGRSLPDVVGVGALDETPLVLTDAQLAERIPALAATDAREAATRAGLLHAAGPDRWVVRSAALVALVGDLADHGAELFAVLDAIADFRRLSFEQGHRLADLFVEQVWSRVAAPDVVALGRRARPLMAQAAASLITEALGDALEQRGAGDAALRAFVDELRLGVVAHPEP